MFPENCFNFIALSYFVAINIEFNFDYLILIDLKMASSSSQKWPS